MKPGWRVLILLGLLMHGGSAAAGPAPDLPPGWDDSRYLRVEDIRPGMAASGRSVFSGARVDTFSAEILGVIHTASPGGDMILARLSGQGLEKSGVIAGMSGSPIYVEGKLIGALAFGWAFSAEPIAGITPIGEMLPLLERSGGGASGPGPRNGSGASPESWQRLWSARGEEAWRTLLEGFPRPAGDPAPLRVPAALSGFGPLAQAETERILDGMGFLPVQGGIPGTGGLATGPLVPGSAVGVELVRGDAQLGVTGTVTWTDGEHLLAFGHPMFNLGSIRMPLCRAEVITVLPSLNSSFKISAIGETVGTLSRDYSTGVVGDLGPGPRLLPMEITLTLGGKTRHLAFELVESDLITPALAGIVCLNSVESLVRGNGAATVRTRLCLDLADGRSISSESIQAGFSPPIALAGDVARVVGLVYGNPFEPVSVEKIEVSVSVENEIEAAFLEGVSVGPGPHRPGDVVPVELEFRDYRGEHWRRETSLVLPRQTAPGTYELAVCDGAQASHLEAERAPGVYTPQSFQQLITLVEESPPSNHVVLRLYQNAPSTVIAGREFPRLPLSAQSVLGTALSGGRSQPALKTVVAERKEVVPRFVLGCQSVSLQVDRDP